MYGSCGSLDKEAASALGAWLEPHGGNNFRRIGKHAAGWLEDAEVQVITIDCEPRKVTLELAIWVGNIEDPPEGREAYRSRRWRFQDFRSW
jgi:hypothetical protein